jgi:hypothetical protein
VHRCITASIERSVIIAGTPEVNWSPNSEIAGVELNIHNTSMSVIAVGKKNAGNGDGL